MTDYLQRAFVLTLFALTAGCAPMNETQCRTTNWYQQGETDGLIGQQARIYQYADQCRQFGVQPAESEYLAGWSDGYWEHYHRASGSKM